MNFKPLATAVCASAVLMAAPAFAQQPAAAPAGPALTHGAAIPGICSLSVEAAIGASAVGRAIQTRMQQLAQQVQAELTAEQTALQNEAKTLQEQRANIAPNAFQQRAGDVQNKADTLQRKAQLRDRELQVTQQKALNRVSIEVTPLIRNIYQQKGCSVLLQGEAVVGDFVNPAMDLTEQTAKALDGKITTLSFDRERLDPNTGGPAPSAGPARPPAAAPARPAAPSPARPGN